MQGYLIERDVAAVIKGIDKVKGRERGGRAKRRGKTRKGNRV